MQPITPIAKDHQVILEGVEVLRWIADRVEAGDAVEPADIAMVLDFLRDVGCACLDQTASLILRPALERAHERADVQRLRVFLACHQTVRPLLNETAADLEYYQICFGCPPNVKTQPVDSLTTEDDETPLRNAVDLFGEPEEEFPGCFLLHAHLLTKLVRDLIFQEDEALLNKAVELLADPDGQRKIEEFADQERRINAIAMEQSSRLHLLQGKYRYPNCA